MVQAGNRGGSDDMGWQICKMDEFLGQIDSANDLGKHLFVWDKQGMCSQLAAYAGCVHHDFKLEQERLQTGVKTLDEVLEKLRKILFACGRKGKNLMLDLGATQPDFNAKFSKDATFKTDLVFNLAQWKDPSNFRSFIKEDDNEEGEVDVDDIDMQPIMIVSTAANERDISAQLNKIPHSSSFYRVIVLQA